MKATATDSARAPFDLSADRPTGMDAWERLPGESDPAWRAFMDYRDSHPRSIRVTAKRLGKSSTIVARWSTLHGWLKRAAAFDADQDRKHLAALEDERLTAARRQAQLGYAAQEVAVQALAATDPATLTPTEATRLLGLGVKIERDALDGAVQVHVTASDKAMTTRELDAALTELEALILSSPG